MTESSGFLRDGGETAALIARHDWAATSIGAIERWHPVLKTTVALILRSPVPIVTLWNDDGVMIYNDAYSHFAGGRHPALLGSKVREGWPEVADFNDNIVNSVFGRGETLSYTETELVLHRHGRPEPLWLNLDYSPVVDDAGTPLGVIAIVLDVTEQVLAARWRETERERLQRMFEQAPSFMAVLRGPEHVFDLVNAAYAQLIGHRDVIGKPIRAALPEVEGQGFFELLDQVYASGQPYLGSGLAVDLARAPGSPTEQRTLDFVYQPMRGLDGAVSGIFVQGSDVTERLEAQQAAAENALRFETFARVMPIEAWSATPDGQLDWFNERVHENTGLATEKLVGERWSEAVHPADADAARAAWAAALASGETYETEFRIRNAAGEYRWHLVRALPIRGDDGRILRWIGTNTDIHARKLAETESARDRDRLWNISQDLMMIVGFDGTILSANPSVTRTLGWSEEELVGQPLIAFVHEDDVASTIGEVAKLATGATVLAFVNRYRTRDGDYRLLQWNGVPDAGRIHGIARDITEERRLARDRERIWTLSPVLKLVIAADATILDVNPSWTRVLGWSSTETIGRNAFDFLAADDRDSGRRRLKELDEGREIPTTISSWNTRDGALRQIEWTSVREGETIFSFGRDLTAELESAEALAATEEALRQSQKMEAVGQLTGGIAHDFNNLLQGITGSLELVQRRVEQGRTSDLQRFIAGATSAANKAAALTHRLLAFSRRQPLDPRPVRANPLIASMEDLIRRTMGERIELEMVLAGGLWTTLCDPNQLENAVLNLAINARDAMPDGGKLTIETCNAHLDQLYAAQQREVRPGQYVCICVTDTGVGMDAETIARAFEPFFTTKPIGQGTGLGLSMIYGFARQSEGYAKIYSEPGDGTTFKLYLPRHRGAEHADEQLPALGPAHAAEAGETVLVVEDEPVVRGLIVEVLGELGYHALEAADGPAGLAILQSKRRIDLLITDIGLPGLNGRQVADAARTLRPELKVLFMTGYAENAALASGFLEHGMSMITKPFAMEALATRIRAIIEETP